MYSFFVSLSLSLFFFLFSYNIIIIAYFLSFSNSTVDWSLVVLQNASEEDMFSNANYVISVARKLGACVFITPEDINEVKPKMIFSFIASLWVEKLRKFPDDGKGAAARGVSPPRPAAASTAPPAAAAPKPAPAPPAPAPKPTAPPPKPIELPTAEANNSAPTATAAKAAGFQSINGSGEKGGVYGGVSGGDKNDVDENEWD
jgi:pyruvate/2-oxoglutarate dehydrogenase complex dihydrolipoamide acyltransferase (E2) component